MTLTVNYSLHFFHSALPHFHHITSVSGQGSASETASPYFLVPISLERDEAVDALMRDKNIFYSQQLSWAVAP